MNLKQFPKRLPQIKKFNIDDGDAEEKINEYIKECYQKNGDFSPHIETTGYYVIIIVDTLIEE